MTDDLLPLKIKGQRHNLLIQQMRAARKVMAEMIAAKVFNEGTGADDNGNKLWRSTAAKAQDQGQ